MVSCQNGPTRYAYAWQIGPFRQDTLHLGMMASIPTYIMEFMEF